MIGFNILTENENGQFWIDIQKWIGKYCAVWVNSLSELKEISALDLRNNEKNIQKADFLDENAQLEKIYDNEIPDIIHDYWLIPMTDEEWEKDFKYHAVIRGIACYPSDNGVDDVDVKVSVYVFNGGFVNVMAKYFNRICTDGKEKFDDFCFDFGIVGENGKVDVDKLENQLCEVTFFKNKKGNFYVDTLTPMKVEKDTVLQQYELLLDETENQSYRN